MAKSTQSVDVKKVEKPLSRLNALFQQTLDTISPGGNGRQRELDSIKRRTDAVVSSEIDKLSGFTGSDVSTFLVKLFNDKDASSHEMIKSIEDVFGSDNDAISNFLSERYRNQNLLYEDLSVITSELFELSEAINTTRDAIVSPDESTTLVSRQLIFRGAEEESDKLESYHKLIENMEDEYKLLRRLKNHIVPKTLEYGKYYVYAIPYSRLFANHVSKKSKEMTAKESTEVVLESFGEQDFSADMRKEMKNRKTSVEQASSLLENISIMNDFDGLDTIVESSEIEAVLHSKQTKAAIERAQRGETTKAFQDKVVDVETAEKDFQGFTDCYIKLIDPRRIVPVKILDEVIGYYYIHDVEVSANKSPFTTNIRLNPSQNMTSQDFEMTMLSKISDRIVKGFDKPYLENNQKFKKLIVNSIIYNDIYKKKVRFQFIPVDYITEFSVNHDSEGEGVSVLKPSLFYAKLYLAILVFKIISIMSKSNDTRIHYVKNSGINADVANQIQSAARALKQRQINFTDLLNHNSMISKIGQNRELFMPIGESGERGIEFEILSGQDIQLNTDLTEMLRTGFINATGVPSVIMNYVNEADYAKTLVMANSKFASRVSNLQADFNDCITELYRKILRFSKVVPEDTVDTLNVRLAPPRALVSMNTADVINNAEQTVMYMVKNLTGENADPSETDNIVKDELMRRLSKELLPMLPWENAQRMLEESMLAAAEKVVKKENNENE